MATAFKKFTIARLIQPYAKQYVGLGDEENFNAFFNPVATTADLADITSDINTVDKYIGKPAYDSDTGEPVWASGADPADAWVGTGGGGGTPGAPTDSVQYNDSGVFTGSAGFTFLDNFLAPLLTLGVGGAVQSPNITLNGGTGGGAEINWEQNFTQRGKFQFIPSAAGFTNIIRLTSQAGPFEIASSATVNLRVQNGIGLEIFGGSGMGIRLQDNAAADFADVAGFGQFYISESDNFPYYRSAAGVEYNLTEQGAPAGADTQIQYNDSGSFGANASFTASGFGGSFPLIKLGGQATDRFPAFEIDYDTNDSGTFVFREAGVLKGGVAYYASIAGSTDVLRLENRVNGGADNNSVTQITADNAVIIDCNENGAHFTRGVSIQEAASAFQPDIAGRGQLWNNSATAGGRITWRDDLGVEFDLTLAGNWTPFVSGSLRAGDGAGSNLIVGAGFNIIIGQDAGNQIFAGGFSNITIGRETGQEIITGDENICIGDNVGPAGAGQAGLDGLLYIGQGTGITNPLLYGNTAAGSKFLSINGLFNADQGATVTGVDGSPAVNISTAFNDQAINASGNIINRTAPIVTLSQINSTVFAGASVLSLSQSGAAPSLVISHSGGNVPGGIVQVDISSGSGMTNGSGMIMENADAGFTGEMFYVNLQNASAAGQGIRVDNPQAASTYSAFFSESSGGALALGITQGGTLYFRERADHVRTPAATLGEFWVRDDAPNVPMFTDDAGTDFVLNASGGGPTQILKPSDESVTNSAVLQDDDDLTFSVAANTVYHVQVMMRIIAPALGGFRANATGPAGSDFMLVGMYTIDTGSAANFNVSIGENRGDMLAAGTDPNETVVYIEGHVTTAGTAGTFTIQWAQQLANATSTDVLADSYLMHQIVA